MSIGVNERDGGTLYNTQLLFDADGTLIQRRRKHVQFGTGKFIFLEAYVGELLERARGHADLKAFITINEAAVLEHLPAAAINPFKQEAALRCSARLAVKEGAFKQMYRNRNRLR